MNQNKKIQFVISASIASCLISSVSFATAWDSHSDPSLFNRPYNPIHYNFNFLQLPQTAELSKEHTPWSDSYWLKQRGAFSYRWRNFQSVDVNQTTTAVQREALFFNNHFYSKAELLKMKDTDEGRAIIDTLSPMEKYDIFIGDYNYALAKKYLSGNGNGPGRASWEGYCHAWAPVASHYSEPAPVTVTNADGVTVDFGSGDVKALLVANYHEIMFPDNTVMKGLKYLNHKEAQKSYMGSGCPSGTREHPLVTFLYPKMKVRNGLPEMSDYPDTDGLMDTDLETYVQKYQDNLKTVLEQNPTSSTLPPNASKIANDSGLASKARHDANQPSCMGVNAGTFHVVMTNQLGLMQKGFELDKTRDGQIWNQPARGYSYEILGYSGPLSTSATGTAKTVKISAKLEFADDTMYGWAYWNPTLKGLFGPMDSGFAAEYDLYQKMLVNQGDQDKVLPYPTNVIDYAQYVYTLDLDSNGNIIGGDWLTLDRPDTLWIMEPHGFEGSYTKLGQIYKPAVL